MDTVIRAASRLWPLAYIAAGLLVGFGVERFVIARIGGIVTRRWVALHRAAETMRAATVIAFTVLGVYLCVLALQPPEPTLDFVRKLLLAFALAGATFVLGRAVFGLVSFYSHSAAGIIPSTSLLSTVAQMLVFVVGGLIVLGSLGISITPLLTALGVGGLAVALALKDPLSNLFAGIQIIASRQVRPGDYVRFDNGTEGVIVDITWNNTTIRDRSNSLVVIPNEKVTAAVFTNYNLPQPGVTIEIKAGVSGNTDLEEAERTIVAVAEHTIEACKATPRFKPFVRFFTITETRVEFSAFLCVDRFVDQFEMRHEFVKRLHERFRKSPSTVPIMSGTG